METRGLLELPVSPVEVAEGDRESPGDRLVVATRLSDSPVGSSVGHFLFGEVTCGRDSPV